MKQEAATAISQAWTKAGGMSPAEIRLRSVNAAERERFLNNGGTVQRWREILHDIADSKPDDISVRQPNRDGPDHEKSDTQHFLVRPIREPSVAQREAEKRASKAIALYSFDRELTQTGRQWGNVGYDELDGMDDDGVLARAIQKHIGPLPAKDRHKRIRELMTPREFALLVKKVRRG